MSDDAEQTESEKEFAKLVEIAGKFGWAVAVPGEDSDNALSGLVMGEEWYVDMMIAPHEPNEFEVFKPTPKDG